MDRKEIQEKRMKRYFIESAMKIIKGEGVRAVNVRQVADEAGYSYSTLYNYFDGLKDLLYYCVLEFIAECNEFISTEVGKDLSGAERIKSLSKAYAKYFVQYPGIFDVFFIDKTTELNHMTRLIEALNAMFADIFEKDWKVYFKNNKTDFTTAENIKEMHKLVINSLLLYYLNRRYPDTYQEFQKKLDDMLESIL
jgi:AcrR family transcriptional regulator